MDLNAEIWKIIDSRARINTEEQKRSVHVEIMRAIEKSKTNVGKKLGVTIMTEQASRAGDGGDSAPARPKGI